MPVMLAVLATAILFFMVLLLKQKAKTAALGRVARRLEQELAVASEKKAALVHETGQLSELMASFETSISVFDKGMARVSGLVTAGDTAGAAVLIGLLQEWTASRNKPGAPKVAECALDELLARLVETHAPEAAGAGFTYQEGITVLTNAKLLEELILKMFGLLKAGNGRIDAVAIAFAATGQCSIAVQGAQALAAPVEESLASGIQGLADDAWDSFDQCLAAALARHKASQLQGKLEAFKAEGSAASGLRLLLPMAYDLSREA